jgi:hypothetical protein
VACCTATPVLIGPNVGPARASVPSVSNRCRCSKWCDHTSRSVSVIVAAKSALGR